ncbi:hypothetical protein RchiOBHm_Chr4g0413391 [Rosa chinensis]|uniref:Uncharacterized protein n=1 Tax=Rosa chinensis TaxID=74649 RepID=A0A2P6QW19_ROSCH|nr:hypothetical protein RchiOBHm_Chr4g0413391 [Rosa chinensis]
MSFLQLTTVIFLDSGKKRNLLPQSVLWSVFLLKSHEILPTTKNGLCPTFSSIRVFSRPT